MTRQRFSGKRIVITGAGRGLGYAYAERLGSEGASVVIAEIDPALGSAAEQKLKAQGIDARFVETDVSSEASVAAAYDGLKPSHRWSIKHMAREKERQR